MYRGKYNAKMDLYEHKVSGNGEDSSGSVYVLFSFKVESYFITIREHISADDAIMRPFLRI
jgi:hypothetical protein